MGQYWMPILHADGSKEPKEYVCTHYWNNGYKFLEHSWIGNEVPSLVMYRIYKNPMHVAWVGDYYTHSVWKRGPTGGRLWRPAEQGKMLSLINYNTVPSYMKHKGEFIPEDYETFKEISDDEVEEIQTMFNSENIVNYVILNHTKNVYLSMKEYMEKTPESFKNLVMHPLPVLTATVGSMGDGMGDYRESQSTNWNRVGTWMWDILSVEEDPPENFNKVNIDEYTFQEVRKDETDD